VHTTPLSTPLKKTYFGRENGAVCDVHTTLHITHCLVINTTHRPIINTTEKICLRRENRVVCDVHTAPLSTLLKKYASGEKTGQRVMCTLPHY
jgi:hypothetical protein